MKEWWQNLALREKQILSLGAAVIILFILYEIIWAPFTNKMATLRIQVQHNQELLSWMRQADQRMQALSKSAANKTQKTTESLLSIMQSEVNKSPLSRHVSQLRQAENDSVQLDLKKVDFDQLIVFLTALSNQYGLIVSQFTAMPTGAPGEVVASVVVRL